MLFERTIFRKAKIPLHFWMPAAVILIGVLLVFVIIYGNAAKGKDAGDRMTRIDTMLSLAADFNECRKNEINNSSLTYIAFGAMHCSTKSVIIDATVYADTFEEYESVEVYRAEITEDGGYGEFERIGVCTALKEEEKPPFSPFNFNPYTNGLIKDYDFTYIDRIVEPGKGYAYRMYAYGHDHGGRPAPILASSVKEAFTGDMQGRYECSIIQNTKKKLIIKLSGKSKETGLLKYKFDYGWSAAHLVYKNKLYEMENVRTLRIIKYSYDGKVWHDDAISKNGSYSMFTIQGTMSFS